MKLSTKLIAVISAAFLISACEPSPDSSGTSGSMGTSGTGASYGAGSQEHLEATAGDRVFFALDSSSLSSEAQSTLSRQADWLKEYGSTGVVLEGHADERGTREYNLALGERRANAAKQYLVNMGISPNRISTISYGKERPAVIGSNDSAWSQNRRAVTVVTQ